MPADRPTRIGRTDHAYRVAGGTVRGDHSGFPAEVVADWINPTS